MRGTSITSSFTGISAIRRGTSCTSFFTKPHLVLGALRTALYAHASSPSSQGDLLPALLLPLLLLPLLRPRWLLISAPLLAAALLSYRYSEWTLGAHYPAPFLALFWVGGGGGADALAGADRADRAGCGGARGFRAGALSLRSRAGNRPRNSWAQRRARRAGMEGANDRGHSGRCLRRRRPRLSPASRQAREARLAAPYLERPQDR